MSGFNYLIKLDLLNGNAFSKLAAGADTFEGKLDKVQGEIGQTGRDLKRMGDDGRRAFDGMAGSVRSWAAGLALGATALTSLNTMANASSMDTAITFAGGADGAKNLEYVEGVIQRLKTPVTAAKDGFKTLSGSMMGTSITAEQQRKIFESVAVASRVMGLSTDNTAGAMLALGQMASKGKVQAEELRGQLGERIPGAFGIAARAMGVTTKELDKMMERGDVVAEQFLPKFADELMKTFGPGLENALNGPRAKFDEFNNSVFRLQTTIGTQLMPTATALINLFVPMVEWIGRNINALGFLATTIGGVWLATKIYSAWAGIAALSTGGLTAAVTALTAAFWANPIGFIIGAVVALGAAVVYAWNRFDGFRGTIIGMWEVIKEFGRIIYDYAVAPLMALGKTLIGTFTLDPSLIAEGIADGVKAIDKIVNGPGIGERIGTAFGKGFESGVGKVEPQLPGAVAANNFSTPTVPGAGGSGTTNADATKLANGITSGGGKNVTINVGKLIEQFTVNTTNMKEGAQAAGDEVLKKLLEALNSANQVQTN